MKVAVDVNCSSITSFSGRFRDLSLHYCHNQICHSIYISLNYKNTRSYVDMSLWYVDYRIIDTFTESGFEAIITDIDVKMALQTLMASKTD